MNEWAKFVQDKEVEIGNMEKDVKDLGKRMICNLNQVKEWERLKVMVDSEACATVGNKGTAAFYEIKPTSASRAGKDFTAANGTTIKNHGQRMIEGKMPLQCLGSFHGGITRVLNPACSSRAPLTEAICKYRLKYSFRF